MSIENQFEYVEISTQTMLDRRESPRHDTQLYVMRSDGWSENKNGNLGIGGCYFETSQAPILGEALRVNLYLDKPDGQIEVDCRVIRLTPTGHDVGVATMFENLPFEAERTIARWLDSR